MRSRPSARDTKQKIKKTYTKIKRICDHGLPREILHSKDTTIQSVKIRIPSRIKVDEKPKGSEKKPPHFSGGQLKKPRPTIIDRAESQRDGPKVRDGMACLTKSISGWYPLNIRGLEKAEGARNTMAKINKQKLEKRDLKRTQSRSNWLPRASRLWPKWHKV